MAEPLKKPDLYDADFYAWTQDQAARLRARASFDNRGDIDWENTAEEIESVGRSEKREIENRLIVVLLHLVKWRFQPAHRSSSWKGSIREQRRRLVRVLADSPSLRLHPSSIVEGAYETAIARAVDETGMLESAFPTACPFTIEDVLDPDFYPEAE